MPEKDCAACGRPFAWRKKWARDWADVKTCSERCKGVLRRRERKVRAAADIQSRPGSGSPVTPGPRRR
ncbi:DUF2256 domain-containing protein [Tahibacter sp.]|uniref:DUF2256 domain-containing protein n=1 Tax=Tahibacter sp. TaxID=2056211 RepID=UPI0031BA5C22